MQKRITVRLSREKYNLVLRLQEELKIPTDVDVLREGLDALDRETRTKKVLEPYGIDIDKLIERLEG